MTTPPSMTLFDLTPAELDSLEQQNLCRASSRPGQRTVSGAFLNPPSVNLSSASSSSASVSVRFRTSDVDSPASFEIPIAADSADALEFIGFVPQVANEIFERYQSRDHNCPDGLMDFVFSHILRLERPPLYNLPAEQACARIGLTLELQEALLDPEFTDIFNTESLHFWVKDTLETNYIALLNIQQRMKNHARSG